METCVDQLQIDEENRKNGKCMKCFKICVLAELMCRLQEEEKAFHEIWKKSHGHVAAKASKPEASSSIEQRIDLLVEKIFMTTPHATDDNGRNIQFMSEIVADGLNTTGSIISNVTSSGADEAATIWDFLGKAEKVFDKLGKIFAAGQTVYSIFKFFADIGKPSEFDQIMAKLDEICQELRKVEATVQQGFADLIAHSDFASFRTEIDKPTQILFDDYMRCFVVYGETPIKEFKKDWEENYRPRHILSTLYTFLTTKGNIFATQLKAEKHLYSTYTTWVDTVFHQAARLITVNVFYYGLVTAECSGDKKNEMEQFARDEMKDLINQLVRMGDRLKDIELERLKNFHSTGDGKQWIKKVLDSIKPESIDHVYPFAPEFLPDLAKKFKEQWKEFNGPHDFYVMISRGRVPVEGENNFEFRQAGYSIGDAEKVTVYPNVAYEYQDTLIISRCIVHRTEEMREANKLTKEISDKLQKIIQDSRDEEYAIASTKDKISKLRSKKPLLIMYNADTIFGRGFPGDVVAAEHVHITIGEDWAAPEGLFPVKHKWHCNTSGARFFTSACRILQVIF